MTRTAVLGAGAWGTALADVLAGNGHECVLWALERDVAASVNGAHENNRFLGGVKLDVSLRASNDLSEALAHASLVCIAIPSQHMRSVLRTAAPMLAAG